MSGGSFGDVLRVDLTMETGMLEETVTVTADAPMLNSTTGISGTSVTSKQIEQLPLGDGTAYMLTRLAPGIMDSSDLHFARPADNGNLAGIVANGVQGGNEFTIDGAPNLSNARGVGFSPPSDAISIRFGVRTAVVCGLLLLLAAAVAVLALGTGEYTIPPGQVVRALLGRESGFERLVVVDWQAPIVRTSIARPIAATRRWMAMRRVPPSCVRRRLGPNGFEGQRRCVIPKGSMVVTAPSGLDADGLRRILECRREVLVVRGIARIQHQHTTPPDVPAARQRRYRCDDVAVELATNGEGDRPARRRRTK